MNSWLPDCLRYELPYEERIRRRSQALAEVSRTGLFLVGLINLCGGDWTSEAKRRGMIKPRKLRDRASQREKRKARSAKRRRKGYR